MKSYTKSLLALIPVLLLCTFPTITRGQWNTNTFVNLEITGLPTADMVSVPTTDGKTWIAFYHENSGNYDMRAQLIDANGYKLLGPNGVLVSNQPSGTATFVFNACVDNANNLIIGCQDQRSGTMQAVVYKISEAGTHLWSSNGVILGAGLAPNPAALSGNDIVVAWNDDASGTLKIQKITAAGSLAWGTAVTVLVGSSTTTRGQLIANTNDKFTMVYQKNAGGISTNLYAQMFNSSGTALYSPLQISSQTTAPYRYYSICAEADTTYFGYYASPGLRFNSFVQRINPSGTIPWGMNGANFNTSTSGTDNYQMETSIGLEPGSPYIWSVCSFCDPNQTNYGVYVQKFLKTTGARQFTDQGKVVYPVTSARDMLAGEIAIVDDNPMFSSYVSDYRIYATRLDGSGNFAWPGNRAELSSTTCGAGNPKGRYGFTPIGPNKCAAVWTENRTGSEMAYAQGISVGGLIGIDVATQGGVPATITTGGGSLQLVATIYPTSASQAVTWSILPVTGNATISTNGLVTAMVDGTVWAKANAVQDPAMADSLLITISGQVPVPPGVLTLAATNLALDGARMNGSVNANFYSSTVSFDWGLTASYGNTATANPSSVSGNTVTAVHADLTGLASGTTYHFRCVGTNIGGTTYGQDLTFTTLCLLPGTLNAITGPATVCAGSAGNVYAVNSIPGATAYIWTLPSGAVITAGNNTNSITVSYSASAVSGNITVYATDGTCNSVSSPAFPVTVTPLPIQAGAVSGVQMVCEGETGVPYSISPIPGVTDYLWTVPTGAVIASGQGTTSITVNYQLGSESGNISVYGTNNCGTGAPSVLPITILQKPEDPGAISGPAHVCSEAFNVQYSVAAITNAYGYVWTLPTGAEITSGNNTNQIWVHFSASAVSGNVTVYGTNGNCLGQTSAPLAVTVDPIPPTPVISQHGDTLVSSANSGNQWYLDNDLIPGATAQEYIAVDPGTYTVIVTINGCSSAVSNGILIEPVGLKAPEAVSGFGIYPNPSNGQFFIDLKNQKDIEGPIKVYNSQGRLVYQIDKPEYGNGNILSVHLDDVAAGLYLIVMKTPQGLVSRQAEFIR